uniref:Uncharacterized protein n=1 Tax=Avena sativa TaxID=4498 RepID=A0ACD5YJB7_AVESA
MLRRWSYKEGSGLGARGQGMVAPLQPAVQPRRRPKAGIGYRKKPYDNGLPDTTTPLAVQDECLRRQLQELSRDLALEEECCDKAIAVLRAMTEEGDDSAETTDALAAVVESRKLFKPAGQQRTPGTWKATLPPSTTQYVVEHVIKPGMAADAQEWLPSWDPDCHNWLRPWMPLVDHLPETLYGTVEGKILGRADEFDYHDVVAPWKEHGPGAVGRDVVSVLEEELFFDRHQDALRHSLQSAAKPSLSEAVAWCVGWKKLFTPELLAQERVVARAVVALVDCEAYLGPSLQSLLVDCMRRLQFVL